MYAWNESGMGAAAATIAPSASATGTPLLLLGAGVVGALIFLPGWAKLLVPAGLVGMLVAGNWSQCKLDASYAATQIMDHTTGQYLAQNVPGPMGTTMSMGCPVGHNCSIVPPSSSPMPSLNCLTSLFPGGL